MPKLKDPPKRYMGKRQNAIITFNPRFEELVALVVSCCRESSNGANCPGQIKHACINYWDTQVCPGTVQTHMLNVYAQAITGFQNQKRAIMARKHKERYLHGY